jgi:RNA polymerase sigma-70 factor (ECF subfamily)
MVTRVTDSGAPSSDAVGVAGAGDEVVADEIVDLQPGLYRFARSLTRDPDEASDLAQEATARALGALRSFTPGTNLRAWLFRILRNTYLNRLRAARLHPAPVPLEAAPDNSGPADGRRAPVEHDVLVRAELRAVLDAFRGLPERYATPLYLTAVEERSYAEVARELGIPIGTVMSRIYRARQLLLSRLAEERR